MINWKFSSRPRQSVCVVLAAMVVHTVALNASQALALDDEKGPSAAVAAPDALKEDQPPPLVPLPEVLQKHLTNAVPLNPEQTIFVDKPPRRVFLKTYVACQDCLLEMLCCNEQTKEHESLLWFRGKSHDVHVGLLATGAKPGTPATFSPEFKPPTGQQVNVFVHWVDKGGKAHREDARNWMRTSVSHYYSAPLPTAPAGIKLPLMELRYDPYNKEILWFGAMSDKQRDKLLTLCDDEMYHAAIQKFYKESQSKPMTADFVFAGSYHYEREEGAPKFYAAEDGYLICVANFAGSLIDVKEASSASDGGQSYEGVITKVPERGTPVWVELVPVAKAKEAADVK